MAPVLGLERRLDDLESKLELARKNREEAKAVQQQWGEEEAVLTERGRQEKRRTEALEQTLLELTGEVDNYKDKLAYSENQASKNLKLYRVKQKEVELAQAKAAGLEDALETVKREKEERRRRREQGKNAQ